MKTVLIVTYYWPPSGGVSVQRIAKFCKYLPEFGWNPVVLTVNNGNYSENDNSYLEDIKNVSHVYKADSWEPHSIFNALTNVIPKKKQKTQSKSSSGKQSSSSSHLISTFGEYVRLNLFIPDSRIGWMPNAVKVGSKAIEEIKPDVILSSSPPYTVHLIAKKLKEKYNIPWVVDFRDPWLENTTYNTVPRLGIVKKINKKLESATLNQSDKVITVGNGMTELLKGKMRDTSRLSVITNGYDQCISDSAPAAPTEKFYISHFGLFYWRRFPLELLEAIKELCSEDSEFAEKFVFRSIGSVDAKVDEYLRNEIPEQNKELLPYIEHSALDTMLSQPQILLLTIENVISKNLIITGKIFDYITTGNPILGIGPVDGDASLILNETNTGKMFDYGDVEGIKQFLKEKFESWAKQTLKKPAQRFEKFERRELARSLSKTLDDAIEKP